MLKLFSLFHLNLMYSSLAVADRPLVIQRCYHPLLDLAESGTPLAIEATALTLEIIADLDAEWLTRLRLLIAAGKIEFVGSGYSQVIAPLAPAELNSANLNLGLEGYEARLDFKPGIWLINEMAYSGGLPQLYQEVGAKAIIMEWNNPWKYHPEWQAEYRFHRQVAVGCEGTEIPLLWIDTLDFQKFQRLASGEIEAEELVAHWQGKNGDQDGTLRFGSLYGSDAEVFDFRPGRYAHEGSSLPKGEWSRIGGALRALTAAPQLALTTLGEALAEPESEFCGVKLQLESTGQPVVVKKQEKYNLNRWAVTGRGDIEANTRCHCLTSQLLNRPEATADQWRELCYLWSSDFRTHITAERWAEFQERLSTFQKEMVLPVVAEVKTPAGQTLPFDPAVGRLDLATPEVHCQLDLRRGLALRSLSFPALGGKPALGTLPHGFYDDIAFGADFYTGHAVVQYPGSAKLTDLHSCAAETNVVRRDDGSISATTTVTDGDLKITKEVFLFADAPVVNLSGSLTLPSRRAGEIHPVHLTFIPDFFAAETLEFGTVNGGRSDEFFPLHDVDIHHGESYSTFITAKSGLGATGQAVVFSDGQKSIAVVHDPCVSAMIPTVRFAPVRGGGFFLRLRYSAQELDETFVAQDEPWSVRWFLQIQALAGGPKC